MSIDLNALVTTLGYVGLAAMLFGETGLFFCFFFPGDSLLFTAGLLASQDIFKIEILIPLLMTMAFLGYLVGYWFGERLGGWLSLQKDSWYFKKSYLERAQIFYETHGKKALILGRLLPIVRTFIPIVAGMVLMPYRLYFIYNMIGAVLWAGVVTLLGYFLGGIFPHANDYLLGIVILIVFVSLLPSIVPWIKKYLVTTRR